MDAGNRIVITTTEPAETNFALMSVSYALNWCPRRGGSAPSSGINSAHSCTNTACYQTTKLLLARSIGRNTHYDFYYDYGARVFCFIECLRFGGDISKSEMINFNP